MKNFSCFIAKNITNCKSELCKNYEPLLEVGSFVIDSDMMVALTLAFKESMRVKEPSSLTSNDKNLFMANFLLNQHYENNNIKCLHYSNRDEPYFEEHRECFEVTVYNKKLIIHFFPTYFEFHGYSLATTIQSIEIVLAITNIFEKMNISDFIQMRIATRSYSDMENKLHDYLTEKCCDFFDIKWEVCDCIVQAINPEEKEYSKNIWFYADFFAKEFLHVFRKELYFETKKDNSIPDFDAFI